MSAAGPHRLHSAVPPCYWVALTLGGQLGHWHLDGPLPLRNTQSHWSQISVRASHTLCGKLGLVSQSEVTQQEEGAGGGEEGPEKRLLCH